MIKYSLLLFLRNIRRQKLFTFINLLGLTVSIASTMLIYLYVQREFSYDRFHNDVDRIYRVNQTFIWGENNTNQFASTGPGVAYAIKEELPEVELQTSIHTPGNFIVSYTNAKNEVIAFEEDRILAADSNFFRMFNFPLVQGDAETVFDQANTLVMTRSTAEKYFGQENPLGKMVRLAEGNGEPKTFEVTGIVEDLPDNSYIEFDVLLSMRSYPIIERLNWSWVWTQLETYIRLHPTAHVEDVRTKVAAMPRKHAETTIQRAFNMSYDDYIKSGKKWELFLQPMTSIHLPPEQVLNRLNDSGNITVIYSFIGAAIFIVLLSCINFMNLSTAQFTKRLKEASVRKILGMNRKDLTATYFFEAAAFCLIALVAALALTQLLLPSFNLITERNLQLNLLTDTRLLLGLGALILLMAVISGSYPAIFLSRFNPVEAIKGKIKVGKEVKSFRNGLVVFQFSVSIVLIICTAIVFQQLKFVSDKDLGFNKENLLVLNHIEAVQSGDAIAKAAGQVPGVVSASWCTSVPPRIWSGDTFGAEGNTELRFPMNFTGADENYVSTLNIKLKAGRNFSADYPSDVDRVIVNEATIRKIGWPVDESVIGKKIYYGNESFEIAGVVMDFNYWSLANPVEPMAIFHIKTTKLYPEKKQYLVLRMEAQGNKNWENTLASLQTVWKQHAG
ncbi:MAG: ABC transporter permease, partial [Cyclobacteriaceae bacterium]|nr:ABC transporter permease [Cyclobacteriaceae bacterium]